MLTFKPLTIKDYERIYKYMSVYGQGSCQHSFVSMYSLVEKYGDSYCEMEGFLYTLRANLCDDEFRVYLAPMGNGDIKKAFFNIFEDAKKYGKKVKFLTLTKKDADILANEFPEKFDIYCDRNLAEYIYETKSMAEFLGPGLSKRRQQIRKFRNTYKDRAKVSIITKEELDEILEYEYKWIEDNKEDHDRFALEREGRMIKKQFKEYDALKLSGVVLRIDGAIKGFGYGVKISDDYYDAIIEKADRDVEFAYRILRTEAVKKCAMDCKYVNMEEDVGLEGLRKLKLSYKPVFLIEKFVATER